MERGPEETAGKSNRHGLGTDFLKSLRPSWKDWRIADGCKQYPSLRVKPSKSKTP